MHFVYVYKINFLKYNLLSLLLLSITPMQVFQINHLVMDDELGILVPGERYFFNSQKYLVACSSFCSVKAC